MIGLMDAIFVVAATKGELWYRDQHGEVTSGRPIAADEMGVVFDDNTTRSLRQVGLREEDVLHSV